jgi:serine-type D-Ala-D-Ala carboxypeptidase/endopeptidase (penicillin-binding protein 4)
MKNRNESPLSELPGHPPRLPSAPHGAWRFALALGAALGFATATLPAHASGNPNPLRNTNTLDSANPSAAVTPAATATAAATPSVTALNIAPPTKPDSVLPPPAAADAIAAFAGHGGDNYATLPPEVLLKLASAHVAQDAISVVVERAGDPRPLLIWHGNDPMLPASTMKLVTTYAGLTILGPDYRWRTYAYADGPVSPDGTLHGSLYLRGTGDPKLVPEELTDLVEQIRRSGIQNIDGALVLDKSYFADSTRDLPPFDDDASAPYNVGPDPLLYAFKALDFTITPEDDGKVSIAVLPQIANFVIENHLTSGRATCSEAGAAAQPHFSTGPDGILRASFVGRYPRRCGPLETNLAVTSLDHTDFSARGFLGLWEQAGGGFTGTVREGAVPQGAHLVATHLSPPLDSVVHDINKFSNNVMARNLFLTIGAVAGHPPATPAESSRVIKAFLNQAHIRMPNLVISNGSGLSRDDQVSALSLASLLQAANASPVARQFADSLPLVGFDGTMEHRLAASGVAGNAHIKTGTLDGVRAIAGYIDAADGQRYIVVSLINDPHAAAARAAHDALLEWVYYGMH